MPDTPVQKIIFAHYLRGLAAVLVLLSHYTGIFWARPALLAGFINSGAGHPTKVPITWLDAYGSWLGAFGVSLFFLVSGFVIPFSLERHSRLGFLVARVVRLWPTYLAGLTLTICFYALSSRYFGNPFAHSASVVFVNYCLGLRDLLWVSSIDGVVWTLEVEIKFYLVCALIAPWIQRGRLLPLVLIAICCTVFNLLFAYSWHFLLDTHLRVFTMLSAIGIFTSILPFMLLGTVMHLRHTGRVDGAPSQGALVVLIGLFLTGALHGPLKFSFGSVMAAMYSLAFVVFVLAYRYPIPVRSRFAAFVADISYPLYVVHGLCGYVVIAILLDRGYRAAFAITGAAAITFGMAYGLHILIERPTMRLASVLGRRVSERTVTGHPQTGSSLG